MLFAYFVYIAQLTKFRRGSSLLMEKFLLMEKTKAEERPWYKKRKKKQALRRKISNKVASNQNLSYIEQKRGFLLFMQVPALTHEL